MFLSFPGGAVFSAEYIPYGRIVRKDTKTAQLTDIQTNGSLVIDMVIWNEKLLFLDKNNNALKTIPKNASGLVTAKKVDTVGLENCNSFLSIDFAGGRCLI